MAEIKSINGYSVKDETARAAVEQLRSDMTAQMGETEEANDQWMALHSNYVTPQMYGAVGDGDVDDTAAFVSMIEENNNNSVFYVPAGTYKVDLLSNKKGLWRSPISFYQKHNITMVFAKGAKIVAKTDNISTDYCAVLAINQCSNIKIDGGEFVGWRTSWDVADGTKRQEGIIVTDSENIWITGVDSHDHVAGAIAVAGSSHSKYVLVENSKAHDTYYHGAYIEGAEHVVFDNVSAWGATLANYACSIDIEGLTTEDHNVDIICKGCYFGESSGIGASIHKCSGVTLVDCMIEGGLNINTGSDYLIDSCEIHGKITQSTTPDFKNVVVQNCVVYGNTSLSSQSSDSASCEWLFKNNTYNIDFTDMSAFYLNLRKGHRDIKFIGNTFNVKSIPTATHYVINSTSGIYMCDNTFNVGSADKIVDITRFWYHQILGEIVLLNNKFNIYSNTTGQYYINGTVDVPVTMIGNVFKEYGSTANNRVIVTLGCKLVCKDNVFDLPISSYVAYDTAADTNIYKNNLFIGKNSQRLTNTANVVRDKIENFVGDAKSYFLEKGKVLGTTAVGSTIDASFLNYTTFLVGGVLCTVRDASISGSSYKYISGVGAGVPNNNSVGSANPVYMSVRIVLSGSGSSYSVVSADRHEATLDITNNTWTNSSDGAVRDIVGIY